MKIRVLSDLDAIRAMKAAGLPQGAIDLLRGKVFEHVEESRSLMYEVAGLFVPKAACHILDRRSEYAIARWERLKAENQG